MREDEMTRTKDYAQAILDGGYQGEGLDKWKARAEVLASAFLRLATESETRIENAEAIIHSALVTGSDPRQALGDAMDALGGESIPIAR